MQLRLGLEGEAEIPEVWATLGAAARGEVIERLAQAMVNAIGAQAAREVSNPVNTQSTKPTKTAKAAARTPRGSCDASSLSRRERSDGAGTVAGATEPARRSRSRADTRLSPARRVGERQSAPARPGHRVTLHGAQGRPRGPRPVVPGMSARLAGGSSPPIWKGWH